MPTPTTKTFLGLIVDEWALLTIEDGEENELLATDKGLMLCLTTPKRNDVVFFSSTY